MEIRDFLQSQRVKFWESSEHKNVRSGFIGIDCPWCRTTDKAHLGIRVGFGYGSCWQCGSHSLVDILHAATRAPFGEIVEFVKGAKDKRIKFTRPVGRLVLPFGVGDMLPAHERYLLKRRIDPVAARKVWKMRGIGIAADLKWRLWLPVQHHGETVSWTTRAIGDVPQRYISAKPEQEAAPIKSVLYGADLCRLAIVIVEGPLDAVRGGPGFASSFGLGMTASQLLIASRFPVRAVCYDAEPLAQIRAREIAECLAPFPGETHIVSISSGKDIGEAEQGEINEIRKRFLYD